MSPLAFNKKWRLERKSGCWLWTGATAGRPRYGCVRFGKRKLRAHRVSWQIHRGRIPNGLLVCHNCDTPLCVNPDHLFLGTHADNQQDSVRKGRRPNQKGVANNQAKLTEREVAAIRADKRPQRQTAADYGIDQSQVSNIKRGKYWRDS